MLQWLRMDPRNLQQFVIHRMGEILEHTNISEWRCVPTQTNPADFVTKATTQKDISLWFDGLEFLHYAPSQWPNCDDLGSIDASEIRRHFLVMNRKIDGFNYLNVEYFSNWKKLYRAVSTFILYLTKLKNITEKLSVLKK